MKLINNGYVIKGLSTNELLLNEVSYNGIEKLKSWPLSKFDDYTSKKLEDEAWERWFGFHDVYEVVPEKDYLQRYLNHCNSLNIKTQILQIETPNNNQIAIDKLKIVDVLGYDCIVGTDLSYFNLTSEDLKELFSPIYYKINSNGLCDVIDDVYEFLSIYNKLLSEGINLEDWGTPVPARISIVQF